MAVTLRASQEGLRIVDLARKKKNWTAKSLVWCEIADTSEGTLGRFRCGKAVKQEIFIKICEAVGIKNWEDIVDSNCLAIEIDDDEDETETTSHLVTWKLEKKYQQFIGRSDDLQEILQRLTSEYQPKIFSITGIGGLGKTAFCHQLVTQAYQANIFNKIAWVRGKIYQYQSDGLGAVEFNRTFRLSFEDALKEIGKEIKLPNHILLQPDLLKQEITKIFNSYPWLIVIDGLEDAESPKILAQELQTILGKSCLIITSRRKIDADVQELALSKLNKQVSRDFIEVVSQEKYLPSKNPILKATSGEIDALVKITDGMPLAMKLVVSQAGKLDIDRIIQRLQNLSEEQQLYDYLFEDTAFPAVMRYSSSN
ncbi:ATP-binding protein [Nodularia chucula]|uniref:ATP-binding protein n=1 Tax=Nodularia chucula TaxID=3093667 RepID=UPI0039C5CD18